MKKPSQIFKNWLESQISTSEPGNFLPTDVQIAEKFGISISTVARLYKPYTDNNQLLRIPGKGTCLPKINIGKPELQSTKSALDNIVSFLKGEIYRGNLKSGEALPLRKHICLQFRVTAYTVSQAYQLLETDHLIFKFGQRYWVGDFKKLISNPHRTEIIFFIGPNVDLVYLYQYQENHEIFRRMDLVLHQAGYRIRFVPFTELKEYVRRTLRASTIPKGLFFVNLIQTEHNRMVKLCHSLLKGKTPVCILEWGTKSKVIDSRVQELKPGSLATSIARETAKFIVNKGFKSAVVFYNAEKRGSRDFFNVLRLYPELKNVTNDFDFTISLGESSRFHNKQTLKKWMFSLDRPESYAQALLNKFGYIALEELFDAISSSHSLVEEFKKYLKKEIWIFDEDQMAAKALSWCGQNKVRVPKQLSILSLQNKPENFHLGLTSCVPDWDSIGYTMAHALIGDIKVEKTSKGYIRCKSIILERQTTP